jgi:hypothetical protein
MACSASPVFSLDPVTDSLVSFDIKSGGIEWTPADSFQPQLGPQFLLLTTCLPPGANCNSSVTTHTLFFSVPIPFADAPASESIINGIYDVIFPGGSAEFQYGVLGAIALSPEPSTIALSFAGIALVVGWRRSLLAK